LVKEATSPQEGMEWEGREGLAEGCRGEREVRKREGRVKGGAEKRET